MRLRRPVQTLCKPETIQTFILKDLSNMKETNGKRLTARAFALVNAECIIQPDSIIFFKYLKNMIMIVEYEV